MMTTRSLQRAAHGATLLVVVATLSACVTGPDYARPELPRSDRFKSAAPEESAQPGLTLDWWRLYNDVALNGLEEEALQANQSLQAAMARVAQSRATARSTRSEFYPSVDLGASATRSHTPGQQTSKSDGALEDATAAVNNANDLLQRIDALNAGDIATALGGLSGSTEQTGIAGTGSSTGNSYRIPFDLSYELDLWGRIRRTQESAQAQLNASTYELETVRQTVVADVAQHYFNIRALDEKTSILRNTLAAYDEQVQLTDQKFQAGLSDQTALLQARIQSKTARAEMVDTQRQREDLEHAIAILLGRAPADFALAENADRTTPPSVPVGLPGDLLRRRPDVAEAEQNLVAASAEIGVAKAEFYPKITLTGSAGFESGEAGSLLDASSLFWSFGPSLSLPIFQGGKLRANLQKAEARYDEYVAHYRDAVLNAYVDVETALTDLHRRADQADFQETALEDSRELVRLNRLQYESGIVDYLNVVSAEQNLLNTELSAVGVRQNRMISSVLLMKALGGGWEAPISVAGLE